MTTHVTDLVLDPLASDPSPLEDGQRWTNSTENRAKVRLNGVTQTLSHKAEVDAHVADVANPHSTTLEKARTAGDTFSGDVNMGGNKITNASAGTSANDVATNQKVDEKIRAAVSGLSWKGKVLDKDVLDPTPLTPATGDRYLIAGTGAGAWTGHDNEIAEWDGSAWFYDDPATGDVVKVLDEGEWYMYGGTTWDEWNPPISHSALDDLNVIADHPGYLDLGGTRAMTGDLDMNGAGGPHDIVGVGTVDGVTVSNHDARHIKDGADEVDGDKLDIDWNPSNYTPSTAPAEVDSVDHLTAHLKGIDDELATFVVALEQKSGRVLKASFSGNPKTATVTFSTAMSTADYSVQLTPEGTGGFSPYVENKTTAGFDINANANNITRLVFMGWLATVDGETS